MRSGQSWRGTRMPPKSRYTKEVGWSPVKEARVFWPCASRATPVSANNRSGASASAANAVHQVSRSSPAMAAAMGRPVAGHGSASAASGTARGWPSRCGAGRTMAARCGCGSPSGPSLIAARSGRSVMPAWASAVFPSRDRSGPLWIAAAETWRTAEVSWRSTAVLIWRSPIETVRRLISGAAPAHTRCGSVRPCRAACQGWTGS